MYPTAPEERGRDATTGPSPGKRGPDQVAPLPRAARWRSPQGLHHPEPNRQAVRHMHRWRKSRVYPSLLTHPSRNGSTRSSNGPSVYGRTSPSSGPSPSANGQGRFVVGGRLLLSLFQTCLPSRVGLVRHSLSRTLPRSSAKPPHLWHQYTPRLYRMVCEWCRVCLPTRIARAAGGRATAAGGS